mmetsp:Transcript_42778/g.106670  ORF Transcript_42778/g.106670 Transcript_42778/m.106670 type:complete len:266 (-) Transcript_42778:414-1211(-)
MDITSSALLVLRRRFPHCVQWPKCTTASPMLTALPFVSTRLSNAVTRLAEISLLKSSTTGDSNQAGRCSTETSMWPTDAEVPREDCTAWEALSSPTSMVEPNPTSMREMVIEVVNGMGRTNFTLGEVQYMEVPSTASEYDGPSARCDVILAEDKLPTLMLPQCKSFTETSISPEEILMAGKGTTMRQSQPEIDVGSSPHAAAAELARATTSANIQHACGGQISIDRCARQDCEQRQDWKAVRTRRATQAARATGVRKAEMRGARV